MSVRSEAPPTSVIGVAAAQPWEARSRRADARVASLKSSEIRRVTAIASVRQYLASSSGERSKDRATTTISDHPETCMDELVRDAAPSSRRSEA